MSDFTESKYTRWYYAIINGRLSEPLDGYVERHHIIPKSFYSVNGGWLSGDPDVRENLVKLSGHEHALCHWLLTKMTTGRAYELMTYAFNMMSVHGDHMGRKSSAAIVRAYAKNREEWSRIHSKNMTGSEPWNKGLDMKDDPRCKGGRKNKGRKLAPDVAEAKRLGQVGRKMSAESSERKRQSMTGFVRGPMSEDEKLKRSVATLGIPKGHGDKVAAAVKGNISINKDGVEKRVKQPDLQSWLDNGWSLGGRPRKMKA